MRVIRVIAREFVITRVRPAGWMRTAAENKTAVCVAARRRSVARYKVGKTSETSEVPTPTTSRRRRHRRPLGRAAGDAK